MYAQNTSLYLYYDNTHANNTTYVGLPNSTPAQSVWDSSYKQVLHMESGFYDSTANNKDATAKFGDSGTADAGTTTSMIKETTNNNLHYNSDYYNGWTCRITSGAASGQERAITDYIVIGANNKEIYLASEVTGLAANDTFLLYKVGTSPTSVAAMLGNAVQLNGDDQWLSATGLALTDITGSELTLEVIINPDDASLDRYILCKNGPFLLDTSGSKPRFSIKNSTAWVALTGNNSLTSQQSTYVAGVYDGSNMKLYENGTYDNQTTQTGSLTGNGSNAIGRYNNGSASGGPEKHFKGKIDEVRITKGVRSAAWIKATYYTCWDNLLSYSTGDLMNTRYTWDEIGNLTQRQDLVASETESFTYDYLDRLTAVSGPYSESYSYNQIGNMTAHNGTSYTYGQNGAGPHAVTTIGGTSYVYDSNGNMTTRGSQTVTWDGENRVTAVTGGASFVYDGDGMRVKKTESGETILYINKFYEKNLTTSEVTTYYYLGEKLTAVRKGSDLRYLYQDHLTSTSAITDSLSTQVGTTMHYLPYGECRNSPPYPTDKLFTGQRLDTTGLYYYGARYYDPTIGRLISPDPLIQNVLNPQCLNRYSYVLNNPLKYTDPSGLLTDEEMLPVLIENDFVDPTDEFSFELFKMQNGELYDMLSKNDVWQDFTLALPGEVMHFTFARVSVMGENGEISTRISMWNLDTQEKTNLSDINRFITLERPNHEWRKANANALPTPGQMAKSTLADACYATADILDAYSNGTTDISPGDLANYLMYGAVIVGGTVISAPVALGVTVAMAVGSTYGPERLRSIARKLEG